MKGTVKFFNRDKNFGFITGEDGTDYFVHGSFVDGRIRDGDTVTFTGSDGDRGPKAENVKRASGDAAPANEGASAADLAAQTADDPEDDDDSDEEEPADDADDDSDDEESDDEDEEDKQ